MTGRRSEPDFEAYALTHRMHGDIPRARRYLLDTRIAGNMRVLDIGCGDGQHLDYLSGRIPEENRHGTEISAIRVERVRAKGHACARVEGGRLPFPDESFDAVIFFEVLEHVPPRTVPELLGEICRVLAPGGMVVGSTPNYPAKRFWDVAKRLLRHLRRHSRPAEIRLESDGPGLDSAAAPSKSLRRAGLRVRLARVLADDPTHQFRCDVGTVGELGRRYFTEVERYTSIGGRETVVRGWHPRNWITQKVLFVFRGPRKRLPAAGNGR